LSTTPTVELAVLGEQADGGIILTASHNPREWNALKLLDARGRFLSDAEGKRVLERASQPLSFAEVDGLGRVEMRTGWMERHVAHALQVDGVDAGAKGKEEEESPEVRSGFLLCGGFCAWCFFVSGFCWQ
jgi:phosphomannomutase